MQNCAGGQTGSTGVSRVPMNFRLHQNDVNRHRLDDQVRRFANAMRSPKFAAAGNNNTIRRRSRCVDTSLIVVQQGV